MVNGAGRGTPPTIHSIVPTRPGALPAAASIARRRNAVVVLPFVPVTPATSSSPDGSPKKTSAATAIAARDVVDDELRSDDVHEVIDDERDGAALDRLDGELVAVDVRTRDAEEHGPRSHPTRVVREVADVDRPDSGHLARGERPDQGLELHLAEEG